MKYFLFGLLILTAIPQIGFAANPGNYPAIEVENMGPNVFSKVSQAANELAVSGQIRSILILAGNSGALAICVQVGEKQSQDVLEKIRDAIPGVKVTLPETGGFASPAKVWGGYLEKCP